MNDRDKSKQLAALWTQAQPSVAAFISSMVHNHSEADDLLQQVAVTLVDKFDQYDSSRPFVAWSIGIARFEILNFLRKSSNDKHVYYAEAIEQIATAHEELAPEFEDFRHDLAECIQQVEGRSKKVLGMRYVEGVKPAGIAKKLGLTSNNVSVMLHRSRSFLRQCIEQKMATSDLNSHTFPAEGTQS